MFTKRFTLSTPQREFPIVTATVTKIALRWQQFFFFTHTHFHKVGNAKQLNHHLPAANKKHISNSKVCGEYGESFYWE